MSKTYILGNPDIDASFSTVEMTWDGVFRDKRIKEQVGSMPPASFEEITPKHVVNTYIEKSELETFPNLCADTLLSQPELIEDLKSNTLRLAEEIRSFADRHVTEVENKDFVELADLLLEAKRLQSDCGAYGSVVAFADIFGGITDRLTEIAQKRSNLSQPVSHYTDAMSSPTTDTYSAVAYTEIRSSDQPLSELAEKYYWLDQGYIGRGTKVEEIKDIKADTVSENDVENKRKLLNELGITELEQQTVHVAQNIVLTKMIRADVRQNLHVLVNKIIDRVSREWDEAVQYLETLSARELSTILRSEQGLPADLSERVQNGVAVPNGGRDEGYTFLTGEKASEYMTAHVEAIDAEANQEIEGKTAQTGKVSGTARLVFGPQHIKKVEEGDILISPSTSPQLLPAMKKAAAFVTDIGGITSHAAIVAREMQKPCVVGTQNGTQISQDGDEVEVDADSGVIKIVNQT